MKKTSIFIVSLLIRANVIAQNPIPAFPCAEGFGAKSQGGRGGRVIYVTNTNDSGPGSLREACSASGARTVIFKVGGLISLKSRINIQNPFITIAGQTAPGDGICVRGGQISVNTHNVIIRYVRSRAGDNTDYNSGINPDNRDCFEIQNQSNPPYNVIFDHCSASWGIDETMSTWYPCRDITIQWCIIGEALHNSLHSEGPHGKGLLIGDGARNISVHHNLFAYNFDRNPTIKGSTTTSVTNNVIAGWGSDDYNAFYIGLLGNEGHTPLQTTLSDMVGNTFIPIGNSFSSYSIRANGNMDPTSKLFIKDNIGPGRYNTSDPELNILRSRDRSFASSDFVSGNSNIKITTSTKAYADVMAGVGANLPKRDAVDTRIINNVNNKTGSIINSQSEVGGYPNYNSGTSPLDTDSDGMPDVWEREKNLNPNNAADGNTNAPSGYTWLEEYLNSLVKCGENITSNEMIAGETTWGFQPNPANENITIINAILGEVIVIIDITGKIILQEVVNTSTYMINMSRIKSGFYLIRHNNILQSIIKQ